MNFGAAFSININKQNLLILLEPQKAGLAKLAIHLLVLLHGHANNKNGPASGFVFISISNQAPTLEHSAHLRIEKMGNTASVAKICSEKDISDDACSSHCKKIYWYVIVYICVIYGVLVVVIDRKLIYFSCLVPFQMRTFFNFN